MIYTGKSKHELLILHSYGCKKFINDALKNARLKGYKSGRLYKLSYSASRLDNKLQYIQFFSKNDNIIIENIRNVDRGETGKDSGLRVTCGIIGNPKFTNWKDVKYNVHWTRGATEFLKRGEESILMCLEDEYLDVLVYSHSGLVFERLYKFLINGNIVGYVPYEVCKNMIAMV